LGCDVLVGVRQERRCPKPAPVACKEKPFAVQLECSTRCAPIEPVGATVDATPWEPGPLAARLRELAPAQLYILIGTTRSRAKSDRVEGDIYEAVDLGLTKLAVEAARAATLSTPPRLVYLSSIGASEGARSAYLRARGKAEAAVMAAGLPWVIARPSFILGDRDEPRRGERVAGALGDGLLAVAGLFGARRTRDRYRSTSPDVLASALIRLAEAPEHDRINDGADLH
jgi:nucleoside-diphosphate-sugar epimerase